MLVRNLRKQEESKCSELFYCNQDDGEYNNNPCAEQCRFCKETEALQ